MTPDLVSRLRAAAKVLDTERITLVNTAVARDIMREAADALEAAQADLETTRIIARQRLADLPLIDEEARACRLGPLSETPHSPRGPVDRFVAPSPLPANWPMKPRRGRNAPVRKMKAAAMRRRSPESCARTALAAALQVLHIEAARGAKTMKQVRDALAARVLDKSQPMPNIEARDAQGLVSLLGLDVADKTARAALKLLADGPLAGFYVAGTRHAPARLMLADMLAAAVAQTPAARVKLPLAPSSFTTAEDRSTPASALAEPPVDGTFFAPGISRTHAVANKVPASPRNPELARAALPPGAQVARTFELCVAAWRLSPSWGQAPLADLARSLVPDDLYRGQEQVQRGLKSLVRAGILREHGVGVVLAWQPARRLMPGALAVALTSTLSQTAHGGARPTPRGTTCS